MTSETVRVGTREQCPRSLHTNHQHRITSNTLTHQYQSWKPFVSNYFQVSRNFFLVYAEIFLILTLISNDDAYFTWKRDGSEGMNVCVLHPCSQQCRRADEDLWAVEWVDIKHNHNHYADSDEYLFVILCFFRSLQRKVFMWMFQLKGCCEEQYV